MSDNVLGDYLKSGKVSEREDTGLHAREESCIKCFRCTNGLSTIEVMLYGNRCTFCADDRPFSFFQMLLICFCERQVYNLVREIKRITPDYDDARMTYLAALGNLGHTSIVSVKKFTTRLRLIHKLKNFVRLARKQYGNNTKDYKPVEEKL